MEYLSDHEARSLIVEIGKRVYNKGYVAANDGNISIRVAPDEIIITPTGVSKGYMTEDIMVRMKLDGTIIGPGKASSECKMHLRVFADNAEVCSCVHAHPVYATAFSALKMSLDHPVVAEGVLVTGNMNLAKYSEPGTFDVPESIAPFIKDYNGALLENHGVITWGRTPMEALFRMEAVEHQAKIYAMTLMLSKATGNPIRYFEKDELEALVTLRGKMGVQTGGMPR